MKEKGAAVILVNLGTPDAPTTRAVRRYLKQFLSDPRVVEAPRLLWWLVLRLFILPFRPRRVARLYKAIWGDDSPIRRITREQAAALSHRLQVRVEAAMTYGQPALDRVLQELADEGYSRLILVPLYPQYSGSTTGAVADVVARWALARRELPTLHLVRDYWELDAWQEAVTGAIQRYQQQHGVPDKLLFSFHGIPLAYEQRGDHYGERCLASARALATRLRLDDDQWHATFQSRFGSQPWLEPYTDVTLREWGAAGVGAVQVVCPGFAADCLETLEEIAVENREVFLAAGGKSYSYIPALNASDAHVEALALLCREVLPR